MFDIASVLLYTFYDIGELSYIFLICSKMWRLFQILLSQLINELNSTEIEPGASLCQRKACDNDSEGCNVISSDFRSTVFL